jgi:hypothetical protein
MPPFQPWRSGSSATDPGPASRQAFHGQVANRALELIGKELEMFIDRTNNLN